MKRAKFIKPFRVERGKHFRLAEHDPAYAHARISEKDCEELLARGCRTSSTRRIGGRCW